MNPEQQRIAIAEACGWEFRPYGDTRAWWKGGSMLWNELVKPLSGEIPTDPLPDYLNDLNAMHEAERMLYARPNKPDGTVWAYVYENHLINITTTEIIATAAQRAEAFLKTIGEWADA